MPTTTPYNFIDSSVDATEGWSRFGADREGVMPMLQVGVGGLGALASDPQAFGLLSNLDKRQIIEEIEENPTFGKKITAALHTHGGDKAVVASAKRAVLNELNPKEFPQSKGEWITLRRRMRVLLRDIPAAIQSQVDRMTLAEKTTALMAIARGGAPDLQLGAEAPAATPAASTGSLWGGLIASVVGAAKDIYVARVDSSTQRSIANINAQGAAAQAAGAAQIAQAQAALVAAQATVASGGGGGGGGGGMSPLVWALPAGLGVLGLILYLVMKR